ncbi:glycosyltransferase family 2 protein [Aquibacillus salsiterrae]|uniref:Glycosyltransferase family 2 protein n=1 Tax=Aquibacillus salsiterrae TaxID=2950439 RepID=A0A9X3WF20_9BACI|nr:glycosyltransferase family 2 protein [Aquibacillus salsiterrae]MDC3415861.1 glycosyltransferase family 2 protein [Aquibacillus salsiterrae]
MKQKLIVFLPAFNEEESLPIVLSKIPRNISDDIDVEVLIIDDGSTDNTVTVAKRHGADHLVSFAENRGLGAAVREGLRKSAELGADIAVMIDADNEYPAWQIPELIAPIVAGEADYVMGSRFLGTINGMKLNRRLGNYFFTALQSLLLRRWIYDGQSGMRAFSRQATAHAEIIHDYNYAQVLTLNLVRQGFRVKEIPIDYQVRTTGQSFIKFKAYMMSVFPAIIREMRTKRTKVKVNDTRNTVEKERQVG